MKYTKISLIMREAPPYFIGSQIRGGLGVALRRVSCINPKQICDGCFGAQNCVYYDFFERKNTYHDFRLDFELGKNFYDFSILLFEKSCEKAPYIISALHLLLSKIGLGKDKKTFAKFDIFVNETSCFDGENIKLPPNLTQNIIIDEFKNKLNLKLITPLRIKKENKFIRDDSVELNDIINSIYMRQMRILGKEFKNFPYEIQGEIVEKNLKFIELTRYSNRQKTKMQLGGIIGEMKITNLNKECYEVLKLGEILGVGKSCAFGLGKIVVESYDE
ncbi:CRISPR system precrRNA processing endoribonuclease RAMP protein Cas6 [Campylobacter sp. JMF_01 NE2]|uniref:CRISPR system precrRNA processing endoribonuclease RAMP protein Cas6 n=1 Tax=unclassified Campylobacter TaxID=2593542 RepID=UPI0022E99FE9|nr:MULTISPECIES: CRISPR system precrRNA processing endoribonuclease RAMP protein Cas6 [unclassified Campylobacter]MDA3052866.1 CRISPR system precrRNA processing endoribonuclease RAMP protein Cas6 [Campylobacter sp. JMF_03 NE3]MDA3067197.1 CRISPR system precrRNA processing endoribonuclease RAMP protein Cas6 [Campylobacter sp. JMF_01 NE2]